MRTVPVAGSENLEMQMTPEFYRQTKRRFKAAGVIRKGEAVILGFRRILADRLGVPMGKEGDPL